MRGIFLVGPPGAGKTTQGARLAPALGGAHRSMGELVRARRAAGGHVPPLSATTDAARAATVELVRRSLHAPVAVLVLDGFPRTPSQLGWLTDVAPEGERVLELQVPLSTCIARMKARGRSGEDMATIAFRHDQFTQAIAHVRQAAAAKGVAWEVVDGEGEAAKVLERLVAAAAGMP